MGANAHIKAGWKYSEMVGEQGGWELDKGDGLVRIACRLSKDAALRMIPAHWTEERENAGRGWYAFVVRHEDGMTLQSSRHPTRDQAMFTAGNSIFRDPPPLTRATELVHYL